MPSKKITNAANLMDTFAQRCVEDMDIGSLMQYVHDSILSSFEKDYSDETLIAIIGDSSYKDLLEDIEYDDVDI